MTPANRMLITLLVAAAAIGAFWFGALTPKRHEASKLADQVAKAKAEVRKQEQEVAYGTEARKRFPEDYQQLVLLGKAVPDGDDTASLLVELNAVAERSRVQFRTLALSASGETAAAPPPPAPGAPTATEPVPESGTSSADSSATTTTTTAAPATEVSAATLPIGATVGTAGLSVMPYDLQFAGDFFHFADFFRGIDRLVQTDTAHVAVDGRLMTIDGFSLSQDPSKGFPALQADLFVTTYLTPSGQGLTAGATPGAPAPAGTVTATPTSTTTPTP
jgi:hypothetical protein